jgi:Na+-transporting NADH:ubiquinone oxidoreductase subunit F
MDNFMLTQTFYSFLVFFILFIVLIAIVLVMNYWIRSRGKITVVINKNQIIEAPIGQRLLKLLADNEIYLPAACGGKGVCGQCAIKVTLGHTELTDLEKTQLSPDKQAQGFRLACTLSLRGNLEIDLPKNLENAKSKLYKVASCRLVSTFMREIKLLPMDGQALEFNAGNYIILTAPAHDIYFKNFDIDKSYLNEWQHLDLLKLESHSQQPEIRAYSIASAPQDSDSINLLVRIATPPQTSPIGTPTGKASAYIFNLKPGEQVELSGPFGDFFIRDNEQEMMFIGGGAGMAPLRSMIRDQLLRVKSQRKMSFWYGARWKDQLCYLDEFIQLSQEYDNFSWHSALSEPLITDQWQGDKGFIHSVAYHKYLANHPNPAAIDYYVCGPPMMREAVVSMLQNLGVDKQQIFLDDFGGS